MISRLKSSRTFTPSAFWTLLGLVLLYYLVARWGNELALRGAVSAVWPASGIGLVLTLRYGLRVWPLLFILAMVAAWPAITEGGGTLTAHLVSALLTGTASALEAVLIAWGIQRLADNAYLDQVKPFLLATLLAVPAGAALGTIPQLFGSLLGEIIPARPWQELILIWHGMVIADVIGIVTLAPPILLWLRHPRLRISLREAFELLGLLALAAAGFGLREAFQAVYLLFAVHIALAVRLPIKWAALAVALTSMILLWRATVELGTPGPRDIHGFFLEELSMVLVLNLTTYAIALLWLEKESANASLETRISERTQALEAANSRLEALSHTDALTDAWNRRYFEQRGWHELERAARNKTTVGLLMLDIDRFKPINDEYGHAVGDMVLKKTVSRLKHELRPTDILARIGGEEFVVLLPECDETYAFEVAERLRMVIAHMSISTPSGDTLPVTISIGIAVHHPPADHRAAVDKLLQQTMRLADRHLYAAKQAGRNRVAGHAPPRPGAS